MTERERILAEQEEAKLLIKEGFFFEIGKRKWHIRPLVFGAITEANKYAVNMKLNIVESDNASMFSELDKNIKPLLNFIAVCILNSKWKIWFFKKILAKYLEWKLNPDMALKIVLAILQMYDLGNFITSIRMIGQTTITSPKPNLIDGKTEA